VDLPNDFAAPWGCLQGLYPIRAEGPHTSTHSISSSRFKGPGSMIVPVLVAWLSQFFDGSSTCLTVGANTPGHLAVAAPSPWWSWAISYRLEGAVVASALCYTEQVSGNSFCQRPASLCRGSGAGGVGSRSEYLSNPVARWLVKISSRARNLPLAPVLTHKASERVNRGFREHSLSAIR
jgi:hypothetical protein